MLSWFLAEYKILTIQNGEKRGRVILSLGWRNEDVLHNGKVKGKNDDDNCACRGGGSHSAAMQQERG